MPEVLSIAKNLASSRFRANVIDKVLARASDLRHGSERRGMKAWCEEHAVDVADYMAGDPDLAQEALTYAEGLAEQGQRLVKGSGIGPGTAGHTALLYFVVRKHRPTTVVETGVAAGFSSAAMLAAMEANAHGELWSSDLPYVRRDHPEALVGMIVPEEHKHRWHLFLDGDAKNLPAIARELTSIDLLHYDSDKSWRGRERALRIVGPLLQPGALIAFDDIEDNGHFRTIAGGTGAVVSGPRSHVGIFTR